MTRKLVGFAKAIYMNVRFAEQDPYNTTHKYLKKNERYIFKSRHKSYLKINHKAVRQKFARIYVK
jgi:hypothetical protein